MSTILFYISAALLVAVVVGLPTIADEDLPDKPGYCKIGNIYIKEGEQGGAPIGECSRLKCDSAEPGKDLVSGVGCGTFVPSPGCTETDVDYTKRYPDCCPREICNEASDEE